jgi:hypothetical protein
MLNRTNKTMTTSNNMPLLRIMTMTSYSMLTKSNQFTKNMDTVALVVAEALNQALFKIYLTSMISTQMKLKK